MFCMGLNSKGENLFAYVNIEISHESAGNVKTGRGGSLEGHFNQLVATFLVEGGTRIRSLGEGVGSTTDGCRVAADRKGLKSMKCLKFK